MRITAKGQVTIPQQIREQAGLLPDTEVDVEFDGTAVLITPAASGRRATRGQRTVGRLRGRATVTMSTDEILGLTREP